MTAATPIDRLLSFLRCPDCQSPSLTPERCNDCGFVINYDGDTPVLLSGATDIKFEVPYISLETVKEALVSALAYPGQGGGDRSVTHLDKGHIGVIAGLPESSTVLELGCGGGQMREYIRSFGHDYIGSDISKNRVNADLRAFGGPDLICDAHALPIKSGCLDLVYSAAVTEHLAAPHRAVQEIFRTLKPGGYFLGNCSFLEPWHDESFFHITPNGAAALLLQAGLKPVRIWPSKGYSGFDALFRMNNKGINSLSFAGPAFRAMSESFLNLKKRLKGKANYSTQDHLRDLAVSAGAVDWIAVKPA